MGLEKKTRIHLILAVVGQNLPQVGFGHRRRIYTEEKAKVVAAVWETELLQFLAVLAIFHQDDLKNRMNSSFSVYHPGAIHPFLHNNLVQNSWQGI